MQGKECRREKGVRYPPNYNSKTKEEMQFKKKKHRGDEQMNKKMTTLWKTRNRLVSIMKHQVSSSAKSVNVLTLSWHCTKTAKPVFLWLELHLSTILWFLIQGFPFNHLTLNCVVFSLMCIGGSSRTLALNSWDIPFFFSFLVSYLKLNTINF